jgi:hypothetical protein
MNRNWDRIVGLFTTVVVGIGSVALMVRRMRLLRPDSYHQRRYYGQQDGQQVEHIGSCHCQIVSFTVSAPSSLRAFDCASKIRYPHISVPPSALVMKNQDRLAQLTERCSGGTTTCFFCATCGEKL